MTPHIEKSNELSNAHEADCLWERLTRWHPCPGPNADFWGPLTGPPLARLVREAGYPIHQQVEILQFHLHWVVPTLGPAPNSNEAKWQSILNPNGFPLEYAWNWNSSTGKPQIRTSWEPIGPAAGTETDPLNQCLHGELVDRVAKVIPNTDMSWYSSLLSSLFSPDKDAYTQAKGTEKRPSTSLVAGMEFTHPGPFQEKSYFVSRLPGQEPPLPLSHWIPALRDLAPDNKALATLEEFLATSPEGKQLRPYMVAIDHHAGPSGSRLKWYMKTASTSLRSVREILTLGGRISDSDPERELDSLYDLIKRFAHLPVDHPEESETVTPTSDRKNFLGLPATAHYFYYFDIAPQAKRVCVKIYLPLQNYGRDDLELATTIIDWMESQGRGSYGENYLRLLQGLAGGKLDGCRGWHTFMSFAVKQNGKIDVTSYLAPALSLAERNAANDG